MRKFVLALAGLGLVGGCHKCGGRGPAPATSTSDAGQNRWQDLASKRRLPVFEKDKGVDDIRTLDGNSLLVHEQSGWSVFPLGATKASAHLAAPSEWRAAERVAGNFVLRSEPTGTLGFTAYDAATMKKAWMFTTPSWRVDDARLLDDGSTLVVCAGKDSLPDEVIAVDAKTGTKKWGAPLLPSTTNHTYVGGNMVVLANPDSTTALDGATGKELWKRPHSGDNGEFFIHVGSDWLLGQYGQIVDAHTGKDASKIENVPELTGIAPVPGGVVGLDPHFDGAVVALDLAKGAIRWKATLPRHDASIPTGTKAPIERSSASLSSLGSERSYPYSLAADDDAVFATRGDGVLHAFDVRDGKERWTWSLLGSRFAIAHGPPFTLYSIQDGVVEVFEEGSVPVEHATITGTLTEKGKPAQGQDVWIGGKKVATDEAGKFTGTFDGRGNVRVVVHARMPPENAKTCYLDGQELVHLEGKGTYDVKLAADVNCKILH